MTDYNMDNQADAVADPVVKAPPGDTHGRVQVSYDEYTIAALVATNDKFIGPLLPEGSRVHDVVFRFPSLGSTATVNVGYADSAELDSDGDPVETGDPDAFLVNANCASAGILNMADDQQAAAGLGKRFEAACQLEILLSSIATGASTGTLKVWTYYSEE